MKTLIGRMRRHRARRPSPIPSMPPARAEQTARDLADAIDRAMQRSQWGLAERLTQAALRLMTDHIQSARLLERIARLRAAQGDWETSLNLIDSSGNQSSSLRLLRTMCLVQLGRRDEAHLDLRQWACRLSAPLPARALLGLMEWQTGDSTAACDALTLNLRQFEDPHTLALLMLIEKHRGHEEQAARWAARLKIAAPLCAEADVYNLMLHSIGYTPSRPSEVQAAPAQIESLAMELLSAEESIPGLVESLQLQSDGAATRLLRAAIEHVLEDLEDRAAGYIALSQLASIAGDRSKAAHWAQQGLIACPMSVTLVRLAREVQHQSHMAEHQEHIASRRIEAMGTAA